jgi:SAM-dependent methyltransferase
MRTHDRSATAGMAPPCPYCSSASASYVSAPDVNRKVSAVKFHLARCTGCGLIFCTNPPQDLGRYYTSDYHFLPDNLAALEPHLSAQKFKIDLVKTYKSAGQMLEIGPSTGMFCRLAQLSGFDVSAIEMDADCARFLNDKMRIRAVTSADPASVMQSENRQYDAICLWHAIEHMPEPWKVLEQAALHLKPDGILVVAAPNPEAWQARILGWRWPHHDLPRHLFGLPMSWISTFGNKQGLTVDLATTRDEGSLYWNRFTWAMLARAWSPHPRLRGPFWRLGLLGGSALNPWEGREGKGATYTMVLRRPSK